MCSERRRDEVELRGCQFDEATNLCSTCHTGPVKKGNGETFARCRIFRSLAEDLGHTSLMTLPMRYQGNWDKRIPSPTPFPSDQGLENRNVWVSAFKRNYLFWIHPSRWRPVCIAPPNCWNENISRSQLTFGTSYAQFKSPQLSGQMFHKSLGPLLYVKSKGTLSQRLSESVPSSPI